jgi:hypothetical protein
MSERISLSRNAWQTYELERSTPGTAVYQSLLNLGFSIDWILNGVGAMKIGHALSGYSFLPLYAIVGSMGPGSIGDDRVVDWLAFKDEWLRSELRTTALNLALIVAEGDSMLPTINPGDMLVVDHSRSALSGDGIYVLNLCGNCLVKRVQVLVDGSVNIVSDNPAYAPQIVKSAELDGLHIAGRVVWHGKRV